MRSLAGGAAGFAIVAALAAASAHAQVSADAPPVPAPGRLIDVGGWRLHLYCTGEAKPNQPRVILESGVGDFSVEWSLVQPGSVRARVLVRSRWRRLE
jgi:hypothetical protein